MLVALLVLSPMVLAGVHWFSMHLPQWHARTFVRPDCVCPSTVPAFPAPAPQAQLPEHRLPWRPWLSQVEARRGVAYPGSGQALRRLAAKLLAGQPISIVSIGGSVTYEGGPEPNGESYIAGIFQYINTSFPHRQHKMQNEGMPSWGSENFEPCVESFVPEDADLVVAEFAHNDRAILDVSYASGLPRQRLQCMPHAAPQCHAFAHAVCPVFVTTPLQLPPFERLLRRLLLLPSKPAVLLLEFYPWWMSFGDGVFQGRFNRQPEIDQTVLGQYYDVPVVSLRAAAWRLMHAGIDGFKVRWPGSAWLPIAQPLVFFTTWHCSRACPVSGLAIHHVYLVAGGQGHRRAEPTQHGEQIANNTVGRCSRAASLLLSGRVSHVLARLPKCLPVFAVKQRISFCV
jgi:hypothetical protein